MTDTTTLQPAWRDKTTGAPCTPHGNAFCDKWADSEHRHVLAMITQTRQYTDADLDALARALQADGPDEYPEGYYRALAQSQLEAQAAVPPASEPLPELTYEETCALDSQSRYGRSEASMQLAVRRIIGRRLAPFRETCREWPADQMDRCGQPAEFLLWGKLFPSYALGPRCYDHAVAHTDPSMPARADQWAILDLRPARVVQP